MRALIYIKETQEIVSRHCSVKAAQRQISIMPIDGNSYEIVPISELSSSIVFILTYSIDPMEREDIYAVYYHYDQAKEAASKNTTNPRYFLMTPKIYFKQIY